MIVGVS